MAVTNVLFHWVDYLVFAISLFLSAMIGVYYGFCGKKQKTTSEFLMGGRNLKVFPVAMSLQASFLSSVPILGMPAIVFEEGSNYGWLALGWFLAFPFTAHIFVPIYHQLQITSAYEYLEMRFNKVARLIGGATFILITMSFMSLVLYAPALALAQVSGLSMWLTMTTTGLVCTFYTAIGGIKAVVWTDTLQMFIILAGLVTLIVMGSNEVGGMTAAWEMASEGGRVQTTSFSLDPTIRYTVWTQIIGGTAVLMNIYAANQALIQRYLTLKTEREAKIALYIIAPGFAAFVTIVTLVGIVAYAFYRECDPKTYGRITRNDQIVPLFVMEVLGKYKGVPGLFTAAVFSAGLSTISSGVNSISAVVLIDVIQPIYNYTHEVPLTDRVATWICKGLAVVFGILTIVIAYLVSFLDLNIVQIATQIFGMFGGPLLALLTLGIVFPYVNSAGAITGTMVSMVLSCWLSIGQMVDGPPVQFLPTRLDGCPVENATMSNFTTSMTMLNYTTAPSTAAYQSTPLATEEPWSFTVIDVYRLSYQWFGPIAIAIAVVVAFPVTFITNRIYGARKEPLDEKLYYNFRTRCCRACRPRKEEKGTQFDDDVTNGHYNKSFSGDDPVKSIVLTVDNEEKKIDRNGPSIDTKF